MNTLEGYCWTHLDSKGQNTEDCSDLYLLDGSLARQLQSEEKHGTFTYSHDNLG